MSGKYGKITATILLTSNKSYDRKLSLIKIIVGGDSFLAYLVSGEESGV